MMEMILKIRGSKDCADASRASVIIRLSSKPGRQVNHQFLMVCREGVSARFTLKV